MKARKDSDWKTNKKPTLDAGGKKLGMVLQKSGFEETGVLGVSTGTHEPLVQLPHPAS